MLSAFLDCLAGVFTESACWCWRLERREGGDWEVFLSDPLLGMDKVKERLHCCSVIALGENLESGLGEHREWRTFMGSLPGSMAGRVLTFLHLLAILNKMYANTIPCCIHK